MSAKLSGLSPRTLLALSAAAVLLYAIVAWLLFVSPKRSDASRVTKELVAAELKLVEAQAAAHRPAGAGVQVSDVLRLTKAMPSSADQAGLVLELTKLADASGVSLRTITPQAPAEGAGGATMVPVAVTVEGSFYKITRFLNRVRTLVTVRRGKLRARGRLLTVQDVELAESIAEGFPKLDATITLHAYVYDGPIAPAETPRSEDTELQPTGGATAAGSTGS